MMTAKRPLLPDLNEIRPITRLHRSMMPRRHDSGFTLLELMVTVTIAAILIAMAFPSMRDFLLRNQVVSQSNNIRANLQFARGQAAATRSYMSICPLAAAGTTTCSTSSGIYDNGWMVYTTAKPNAAYDSTLASNVIQQVASAPNNVSVRASNTGPLTYNARGELLYGNAPSNVTFVNCAKSSSANAAGTSTTRVPGIQLSASSSGRIASNTMADGASCIF